MPDDPLTQPATQTDPPEPAAPGATQVPPEPTPPPDPYETRFASLERQIAGQNPRQTALDAILRAVADSRDLISKPASQAPPARVAAASGQIGAMHRAASAPKPTPGVSDAEASVAKKMGIKDPKGALERFQKRQDEGRSTVSPTIVSAVREA